ALRLRRAGSGLHHRRSHSPRPGHGIAIAARWRVLSERAGCARHGEHDSHVSADRAVCRVRAVTYLPGAGAMRKRRRWLLAGSLLLAAASPRLIYRFAIYPTPPRGLFDQTELGADETAVRQRFASWIDERQSLSMNSYVLAEDWEQENGWVEY